MSPKLRLALALADRMTVAEYVQKLLRGPATDGKNTYRVIELPSGRYVHVTPANGGQAFAVPVDLPEVEELVRRVYAGEAPEAWADEVIARKWVPRNLDDLRACFPGVVGEDANVKLIILALGSLLLENRNERVMGVVIESANSAGKSHISQQILRAFRYLGLVEELTRATGAYLERALAGKNLDGKILYLQEVKDAPAQLHIALSEGKLRVGIVERVDGKFQAVEITAEGQPLLFATTVMWQMSMDMYHRSVIINLDETEEQTARIIEHIAAAQTDPHTRLATELEVLWGAFRFARYFASLRPVNVVIPYARVLAEGLRVERSVKLRRDFPKMLALVKAHAALFQNARTAVEVGGRRFIIAEVEDFDAVAPLFATAFRETITNLSKKEEAVLTKLREALDYGLRAKEIAQALRIPQSTVYTVLQSLVGKGFVYVDESHRPYIYYAAKGADDYTIELNREKAQQAVDELKARLQARATPDPEALGVGL